MVHVGAGTGYYKVIMAHLVFSTDKVLLSNTDRVCPLGLDSRARRWRCAVISSPADVTHTTERFARHITEDVSAHDLRSYVIFRTSQS
jgi:hypothetical protein